MVLQRMAPEAEWHMSVIVSMLKKIVKSFKNFVYKEAKKVVKYSSLYVKLLKFCFQSSLQSYWLH